VAVSADEAPRGWTPVPDPTALTTEAVQRATVAWDRALAAAIRILEARMDAADVAVEVHADRARSIERMLEHTRDRLREETSAESLRIRELLEARFDGMDQAIKLHAEIIDRLPMDRDKAIGHLASLHDEKFSSIAKQFAERDTRTDQTVELIQSQLHQVEAVALEKFTAIEGTFASNALALTAALAAQKEAAAEAKKSSDLAIDKSEKTTQETIRANDAKTASGISAQAAVMADIKDRLIRLESGGVAIASQRTEGRLDRGQGLSVAMAGVVSFSVLISLVLAVFTLVHG